MDKLFQERIVKAAEVAGNAQVLADRAGVSRRVLGKYMAGESDPSRERLVAIADGAGVSVEWLATGRGPMLKNQGHSAYSSNEFALIPRLTVAAAAGGGAIAEDEGIDGFVAFARDWLRNEGLAAESLVAIRVVGDSMEPTIPEGALVLVDRREEARRGREGIFVLRVDEDLLVKRLVRTGSDEVRVKSDNPAYPEWILKGEGAYAEVIGRVVWMGRRV